MSNALPPKEPSESPPQASGAAVGAVVGVVVLTVILVVAAVLLAANAERTAPVVEIVRDVLIIVMALELVIIGAALAVFIVQVARFINLMNNEVQPILNSATDTVNAVRGTALFLNKHLTEPLVTIASALGGLSRVMKDADAIRRAAGIAVATASAHWPTGQTAPRASTSETGSEKNAAPPDPVEGDSAPD